VYVVAGVRECGDVCFGEAGEICCCDTAPSGWRSWCGYGPEVLAAWVERTGRRAGERGHGGARFAFYGRVSTEDWQDPVTSRPQAAALVAGLADPDRGWDAIVIGEYERAFYGGQYASMAPLFEHYGVTLWAPEVDGRIDWHAEDHEQTMLALGFQSKREITQTRIRVRTAMAAQTREQGRYLGGRPPYGYGWLMRGHTRTRRTPHGAAGRTAWNRTRLRRRWCSGCSASGWPGTAQRGSPGP
jgi:site-specific DNA recombinase